MCPREGGQGPGPDEGRPGSGSRSTWSLELGAWRLEVGGWRLEVGGWRVGGWRFRLSRILLPVFGIPELGGRREELEVSASPQGSEISRGRSPQRDARNSGVAAWPRHKACRLCFFFLLSSFLFLLSSFFFLLSSFFFLAEWAEWLLKSPFDCDRRSRTRILSLERS